MFGLGAELIFVLNTRLATDARQARVTQFWLRYCDEYTMFREDAYKRIFLVEIKLNFKNLLKDTIANTFDEFDN